MMEQPENTIPFNIEKWKEGYEVVCRDGTVLSELHYFKTKKNIFKLIGIYDGLITTYTIEGKYLQKDESKRDLFLHQKMEKWYRRAFWSYDDLMYTLPSKYTDSVDFREDRFVDLRYKWAGPIEEFEVMAREGEKTCLIS